MLQGILALGLAGCVADLGGEDPQSSQALGDVRLRLMAANTSSGNLQSYDPGEGIRLFQGVKPDIAMIQEMNFAAGPRAFVDQAFGPAFYYVREDGAQIPNGVVSRYPIIDSGHWTDAQVGNRSFVWARIDIPGSADLWVVSVHLLTSSISKRSLEAAALVSLLKQYVPAGDFIALGGDFNTGTRGEPAITTFGQVFSTAAPYPADGNGNGNTSASRSKPYDWVLVSPELRAHETSVDISGNHFANGLVVDSRVYSPLADLAPVRAGDSGATNMQHMPVVRDFLFTSDVPPATLTITSPNGGESWDAGSTHTITWTAANVDTVEVDYSADHGATWTVVAASVAASPGSLVWTVPSTATTSGEVRVSQVGHPSVADDSDGVFAVVVAPPPPPPPPPAGPAKVILNEILANEPGSDTTREFVELVNVGGQPATLDKWTIVTGTTVRHVFATGTTLAPGKAIVVFAGASAIPAGLDNAVAASSKALVLGNGGSTVTVKDGTGKVIDQLTYPSALAAKDGVSMNRSPDANAAGTFVLHTTLGTAMASPGTHVDGSAF